jgi:hypothetical protein
MHLRWYLVRTIVMSELDPDLQVRFTPLPLLQASLRLNLVCSPTNDHPRAVRLDARRDPRGAGSAAGHEARKAPTPQGQGVAE